MASFSGRVLRGPAHRSRGRTDGRAWAPEGAALDRIEQSLFSFWRQADRVAIYLPLRDRPYVHTGGPSYSGVGLFYLNGRPKPAFRAFRSPFVTRRSGRKRLVAWSLAPASGRLKIEPAEKGG